MRSPSRPVLRRPSRSDIDSAVLSALDHNFWWGRQGSNLRPRDYESPALTAELRPPAWCYALWNPLHLHSLRHYSATQLVAGGHDIRTVAGRLGHADASVTLRVYSHVLPERDRDAAATLGHTLSPSFMRWFGPHEYVVGSCLRVDFPVRGRKVTRLPSPPGTPRILGWASEIGSLRTVSDRRSNPAMDHSV